MTEAFKLNTKSRSPPAPINTSIRIVERNMPTISDPTICPSKSCVHKNKNKMDIKDSKRSKKLKKQSRKKIESESETSDSDESDSSSESDTSEEETSDSESSSSSSSSSSESEDECEPRRSKKSKAKAKSKKTKKVKVIEKRVKPSKSKSRKASQIQISCDPEEDGSSSSKETAAEDSASDQLDNLLKELESKGLLKTSSNTGLLLKSMLQLASNKNTVDDNKSIKLEVPEIAVKSSKSKLDKKDKKDRKSREKQKTASTKESSKAKYKRLDEIWDETVRDYRLKETTDKKEEDLWEKYAFTVRRKFTTENRFLQTVVEIKSVFLKDCLRVVMEGVEGVSLVEKTPRLVPDMLFLYVEDFREYVDILKAERKKCDDKKIKKSLKIKAQHLGALVKYLDKDYDETKKTLYPMLENGTITFDLLWALYKPNTLAYATTYGDEKQPRAFRIDSAFKERHCMRGPYYAIEGRYFDYDGEKFGWAFLDNDIYQFQGARKITSLPCYPLKYHANEATLKATLIERGKKFLTLAGMKYKVCQGTAYIKKDQKVLKTNINGRVMVDPKTFRRINPNYPLSDVESRDFKDENEDCTCEKKDSPKKSQPEDNKLFQINEKEEKECEVIEISKEDERAPDNIADLVKRTEIAKKTFTEEELLLASSVLPGFSFSEKLWVELAVSTISEVQWNEGAFDSLVIPEQHKSIVKALVTAHGLHSSKSIDDVVSGKGKGLVAVLHGKPGLGKTLTCEAISDLLKRPLYSVTAGDLGTHATNLEYQLQVILDVAHAWGAVLLLDEADVFLETRSTHDVHRNAMVSVFLRMLEYFSGILMMTTNRVETFDDAFVSRIHLSLRYSELTIPARKTIWKTFITKVAESAAASGNSTTDSESSSAGMPTPETTSSTPNSGAVTPAASDDASAKPPTTPTTPLSTHSATSVESAESDKTVTPSALNGASPAPTASGTLSAPAGIERITEANYVELARVDVNGRQIKNLVKTAQALALYEGVPMGMSHLRRCIEVGRSFEMDLKGGRGWEDVMRSYT